MIKTKLLALFLLLSSIGLFSQDVLLDKPRQKGQFFIFWGYNRSVYAKSDIHFRSDNYNFTLYDVPAHDLPENFSFDAYLNPTKITIPQFNARGGYFITDKYAISVGWDHTKYQTQNDALVKITGTIDEEASEEYAGNYDNDYIEANHNSFIRIEHSDGLNLIQLNIERHDLLVSNRSQTFGIGSVVGTGLILPMPWTNANIFGVRNDDRPHFTGVGFHLITAVKLHILSHFFIQIMGTAGYVHMPGIVLTPKGSNERASQNIKFLQGMIVIGYQFRIF